MMADVEAGFAYELHGGETEARQKFGALLAAGKLAVVQPPGKKPRLCGDGTISGTNARSRICEKVRLPSARSVQSFFSRHQSARRWSAFSWDVSGAHKLVYVHPDEQGLSCFMVKGRLFVYRTCYFGCRWAAYWFSRVGAFMVRMLHRFLFVPHFLALYVDDGLSFLPFEVAPLMALWQLCFMTALGVPLSLHN